MYYQSYLFTKTKYILIYCLKQNIEIFIGLYYSGRLKSEYFPVIVSCTFASTAFMFACMYFQYLQDIDVYNTKRFVELSMKKIECIVGAIPDGISVLNNSLSSVFSNEKMKDMTNGMELLTYLSNLKYYTKYGPTCSEFIIDDIYKSLNNPYGFDVVLGVTSSDDKIVE